MEYGNYEKIAMTIEQQLESYCQYRNSTERHKCLWHAWNHNKRWLIQMLEWVMPSFPSYSKHDVSHAETVLHNIEMLMGGTAIKNLSASDCFLILHVVYIHDIGMCITSDDREKMMENSSFVEYLKKCGSDPVLKKYADILLAECEELMKSLPEKVVDKKARKMEILKKRLDVYYALTYLMAEFWRRNHGLESKERLSNWVSNTSELGAGFSTSGIPSRFFYTIAICAGVHTSYDFNDIMALSKQDGGYAHDYMHPRFAAVLLQLGDALDLDNNRFHPLMEKFNYNIPETSKIHLGKHKSIRRLRISPSKITIHSNCEYPRELRQVYCEYENIADILKNATFYWSAICPEQADMVLPELEPLVLQLKGKEISADLVNVKFEIQQNKAFNLLQGSNIYKNEKFVFLREVFQNAIDATKKEYWRDWQGSQWKKNGEELCENFLDPHAYPVELEFHLAVKEKYSQEYNLIDKEDAYKIYRENITNDKYKNPEYGVVVKVVDYGVGITKKDILNIADVGSGYNPNDSIYEYMPEWLRPTAEFGLGLQSIFLVADYFKVNTYVRTGECYEIEFHGTGDKGDNSINVAPISESPEKSQRAFGTCFEIFVSNENMVPDYLDDNEKQDPFAEEREDTVTNIDKSRELIVQMVEYMNDIIGEKLFPVKISVYDYRLNDTIYERIRQKTKDNLYIEFVVDKEKKEFCGEAKKEEVTWTYTNAGKGTLFETTDNCKYYFDFQNGVLKVADKENQFYAAVSAERIMKKRRMFHNPEKEQEYTKTRIYYKGVYVTEYDMELDLDMLEYIDIKGDLDRECLAMNRSEFTEKGQRYIREDLYPQIINYILEAINDFNNKGKIDEVLSWKAEVEEMERTSETLPDTDFVLKKYLFVVGIVAFMHSRTYNTYLFHTKDEKQEVRNKWWNKILEEMSEFIVGEMKKYSLKYDHWSHSSFCHIDTYKMNDVDENFGVETKNLADILLTTEKYAIISKREHKQGLWNEMLIQLNSDSAKKLKRAVMDLKTQSDMSEQEDLIEKIENQLKNIAALSRNIDSLLATISKDRQGEHQIIMWMLENFPSMAVYSNEENTLRINVLDCEQTDSVYISKNLKYSIYERMIDTYKKEKVQRFSTVASTAFCQLGVEEARSGIRFLKRGKLGKVGRRSVIVPLTGKSLDALKRWLKVCNYCKILDLYDELYNYSTSVLKYIRYMKEEVPADENPESEWDDLEKERVNRIIEKMQKSDKDWDHLDLSGFIEVLAKQLDFLLDQSEAAVQSKKEKQEQKEQEREFLKQVNGQITENFKESVNMTSLAGMLCECLLNIPEINKDMENNFHKWKDILVEGWKLLKMKNDYSKDNSNNDSKNDFLYYYKNYLCLGTYSWEEIKDGMETYFAFEFDEKKMSCELTDEDKMKQTKIHLIQEVKDKSWVKVLSYHQIEVMYCRFIQDILDTLCMHQNERREKLARNFLIKRA